MYDMGNKDGFGLMWVEKVKGIDRVQTLKSMLGWQAMMDAYEKHMDNDIAVHVRNASIGMPKDLDNCHPFKILSLDDGDKMDLYMMHNGRFGEIQVDKKYSDSWNFATKFLRGYLKKHSSSLQDEDFQYFLAGLIGNNKLVFLDNKNRFTIVNADLGAKHPTGVWVSTKNDIKLAAPVVLHPNTTKPKVDTVHQFGESPAWTYKKGKWETDSDSRLHYIAFPLGSQKTTNEQAADTTIAEALGQSTDSGTHDEDDINEEALVKVMEEIHNMSTIDIFNFVVNYHKESLKLLTSLTTEDKGKLKLMIANSPWDAAHLLIQGSQEKSAAAAALN